MRESIGGTWIFSIVITFIVLFSSYLAISINYSKAFKVKNGIVSIIEKDEGFNTTSEGEIQDYLSDVGYMVYSSCGNGYKGRISATNGGYKYCIQSVSTNSEVSDLRKTYYKVKVFFKLDLPIVGNVFVFPVTGETKTIYYGDDVK